MSLSRITYTADGSTQIFGVPFVFRDREDVFVYVDGTVATFTWQNDAQLTVTLPVVTNGAEVQVIRRTKSTALDVTFIDGSGLPAGDLNAAVLQLYYLLQESLDDLGAPVDASLSATQAAASAAAAVVSAAAAAASAAVIDLTAPGPIGGTTPGTGAFTTVSGTTGTFTGALSAVGLTTTGKLLLPFGANIASATTTDISVVTGGIVHITGTTTITTWTMTSGQIQEIIFDDILQLTHHATTNKLLTSANITTAAGDRALYHYDGTTVRMIDYQRLDGSALLLATQAQQEAGTSAVVSVTPSVQHYHPSAAKAWVYFNGNSTVAIVSSYNMTSITDHGVGDYTLNFATDFSSLSSYCLATSHGGVTNTNGVVFRENEPNPARAAGSVRMELEDHGGSRHDCSIVHAIAFGDQ
jgi:hypothetical protein